MAGHRSRFSLPMARVTKGLGALVVLSALLAPPARGATFTVNSVGDGPDAVINGVCADAGGFCTLRAAIQEANAAAGPHSIRFNIAPAGAHTIVVGSAFPDITKPVTIDGTTQPGWVNAPPYSPVIEMDGSSFTGASGLTLGAGSSGSTIRGLAIHGFANVFQAEIKITQSSNNLVAGNCLGTDGSGTVRKGGWAGILVQIASANNTIGGTTEADRNVISGNDTDGVQIRDGGSNNNVVVGNYIGVDRSGTAKLTNTNHGVVVWAGASNNTIGGTTAAAANVISGNGGWGVDIHDAGTLGNVVLGNKIGVDKNGVALGNTSGAARIRSGATGNTIGGAAANAGNTIANNGGIGVLVMDAGTTGNVILGNSIFSNGGLGIDVGNDGVTANDTGDADTGPNNLQNFPVLSAAMTNGAGSAAFAGSLNSTATTAYRIELFASGAKDPTGFGEGQRYLGSTVVITNAAGNATIGVTLATALAAGEWVTATATVCANGPCSAFGDTSEFSAALQAVGHLVVTTTADTVDGTTTSVANLIADPGADGRISLREAITAANNTAGADTITFGIPITDAGHIYYQDNGVAGTFSAPVATTLADLSTPSSPVISGYDADYPAGTARSWYLITVVGSALPDITSPLVLDTTTQPLSVAGTGPVVELNGAGLASAGLSLMAGSDGSTIRGFVINRCTARGILVRGSANNVVAGNFLGTNPAGTAPGPGNSQGIFIGNIAPTNNNRVGGAVAADRNIISGNTVDGVDIAGVTSSTANNVVEGNYIGTDVTGTLAVPNTNQGVAVFNNGSLGPNTNNVIGGTAPGAGNVISGNGNVGVLIRDPETTGTLVQGNRIGTNAAGTAPLPNGNTGVEINATTSNSTVGGTAPGAGNLIAYNNSKSFAGKGGVAFAAGTGNAILGNSIYANTGLGIDLNEDGVTPNDPLDADSGPNDLLNFPEITSASPSAGTVTVWFRLDVPAGSYRIEFFKNPSGADPSGYGEGQTFAGSTNLTHPGTGVRFFNASFPGNAGDVITATTTYCTNGATCTLFGSTSEFAKAVTAFTTAVELMSFTATGADRAVDLAWQTGSELSNLGFHLYRSPSSSGPWTRLTSSLIPGLGSSPLGQAYSWLDTGLVNGQRYYYRLEDVDASSVSTFHGPISAVPQAASPPSGEGSGSGGSGSGTSASSCPAWVRSAYGSSSGSSGSSPGASSSSSSSPTCQSYGDPSATSLRVLSHSTRGAVVELETSGFVALREASGSVRVFIPGFDSSTDPSSPALPLRRALVDAVVGRGVKLDSVEAFSLLSYPGLWPAATGRAQMAISADGTVRPSRRAASLRPAPRNYLPQEQARLGGVVFQGEDKHAVVEISPVRFDPARSQLVLARRVRVKLSFAGSEPIERGAGSLGRRAPRAVPVFREVLAQLYTSRAGLYAVRFEELFPLRRRGFASSLLRLQRQGEAVSFHVEPAGTIFGPGSVLFFYADTVASSTDFSSEVAYELVRASGGQTMGVVGAPPSGAPTASSSLAQASFEINRIYQAGLLDAPDIWLWDALWGGVSRTESFSVFGVDSLSTQPARLVVFLQGASETPGVVDHHLLFFLNGAQAGETSFAGESPQRFETSLPVSLLREGSNDLTIENVGDTGVYSLVFLDKFSLAYPQTPLVRAGLFDGTWTGTGTAEVSGLSSPPFVLELPGADTPAGTSAPTWLSGSTTTASSVRFSAQAGHRTLVASREGLLSPRIFVPAPSSLKSTQNQADFVVIGPQSFSDAAQPLLERRAGQGLVSTFVSLEEIASVFGHGQASGAAIHDFLSFAFQSWSRPSPRYVLLLGDSTYDPQHFLTTSWASPLPALWTKTSFLWTVSDPALAAVNGDDNLPDLAIGRLPAQTPEEAQALVQKVLDWEDSAETLDGEAVLVADNPDEGGDFEADVADIETSFLAGRSTTMLKLSELGGATRPAILDSFNQGASLMSYVGHGGAAVWASENILNSWDVPSLQAQARQPLMITLDCLNGYFVAPNFDALSEAFLKAQGRGTIASISPSGLSVDGPAHVYHRALMAEIVSGQHQRLGDAVLAAQKTYAQTGLMPELLSVYHLLGDPTLKIR